MEEKEKLERFRNYSGKFDCIIFEGSTQKRKKLRARDGFLHESFGDRKYVIATDPIPERSRRWKMVFYVDTDTGVTFDPRKPEGGLSPDTVGALFDDRFIRTVFKLEISKKTAVAAFVIGLCVGLFGGLIL